MRDDMQKRAIFSLFLIICTQTSCVMICHYFVMDKKKSYQNDTTFWWGEMDSNHRRWKPTDLQSVAIGRSATSPYGAGDWNRTHNLLITSQLLCQLSYASINKYNSFWCLGAESNHRHGDFQSPALPTELPRQKKWRPGTGSNRRPPAWQAGVLTNWTTGP